MRESRFCDPQPRFSVVPSDCLRYHDPDMDEKSASAIPASDVPSDRGSFATTRWSVVLQAGLDGDESRDALETLCRTYWRPLYVFARGRGASAQDAEDLTQGFLYHLMSREAFAQADPARGRFRSFLLAAMRHYMTDQWARAGAKKRGGGQVFAIDFHGAETWVRGLASGDLSPEEAYEKRWALALLEDVYERLRKRYQDRGKGDQFDVLRGTLVGPCQAAPTAELARDLNLSEGAVRVRVYRLRREFRDLLREAVADLVQDPDDVEDELNHLQRVLRGEGQSL